MMLIIEGRYQNVSIESIIKFSEIYIRLLKWNGQRNKANTLLYFKIMKDIFCKLFLNIDLIRQLVKPNHSTVTIHSIVPLVDNFMKWLLGACFECCACV
jgi:hypothetical protein